MNEKKALEKLQSMAEDSKGSLKKFLAKEILTYDEPLDVTEYLASPNFVRKYDKRNKNLTTLSSVVFCYFCEVKF